MALRPKSHSNVDGCYASIGRNGFEETVIDNLKDTFEISPDYKPIYIVHDSSKHQDFLHELDDSQSYGMTRYKAWIYDGTEEEQIVGHKYVQMYPYGEPVLQHGDYITFDYHNDNLRSVWLCLALDTSTLYQQKGKIRRCTNEIRFYNDHGELIKIPCVFDDKINSEKDIALTGLKYINGITTLYMQDNSDSEQLRPNQRLLFGRPGMWTAFKIVSVGVNNFMNEIYWDNATAGIVEVTMEASYVNHDTDDLVNGIADANTYSIKLDVGDISASVGDSFVLNATVLKNGKEIVDRPVVWYTSDEDVATVDGGIVTVLKNGFVTISACLDANREVKDSIAINVPAISEDVYTVVVSPYAENSYGILQGDTVKFDCYLYKNGFVEPDVFNFAVSDNTDIPSECYKFNAIDGNSFSVKNIRRIDGTVYIVCKSGEHEFVANIKLKGAW